MDFGGTPGKAAFKNKRAEMWGDMRDWLVAGGALPPDQKIAAQISGPTYDFDPTHKLILEAKKHMKERGLSSPDRADALALTFAYPVTNKSAIRQTAAQSTYDPLTYMG